MQTYLIHLIRHAKTQGNLEGRYIGHTDQELCSEGIEELKRINETYGPYPKADAVFSSPLKRCLQTSEIIYPDKKAIVMDDLIEYNFGEFEGKTAEELKDDEDFAEWLRGENPQKAPPFGDKQADFNYRICSCFEKIVDAVIKSKVKSTAVITHGGVIMAIMAAYALPQAQMHEWMTPSCCGYTLRIDPSLWMRVQKAEAVSECPSLPLTEEEEMKLWDYYEDENNDNN